MLEGSDILVTISGCIFQSNEMLFKLRMLDFSKEDNRKLKWVYQINVNSGFLF